MYSRTKELSPASMKKVYQIASDAGMDPDQFCRIRNGCFPDEPSSLLENGSGGANQQLQQQPNQDDFFRGILASTRISQLLGVEPVAARDTIRKYVPTAKELTPEENLIFPSSSLLFNSAAGTTTGSSLKLQQRPWWNEVGDYLENPHRHFQAMDNLRVPMIWPDDVTSK